MKGPIFWLNSIWKMSYNRSKGVSVIEGLSLGYVFGNMLDIHN